MEEMSFQDFVNVLFNAGVICEKQQVKWEDILHKLSCYYYYLASDIRDDLPNTATYYSEMADKIFDCLYRRKYYD